MAYAKKTCAECGWQGAANEMHRVTHNVNSGSSNSGFTARNIAFSLVNTVASKKLTRTIVAPNKRVYKRKRTVWMCTKCARNHIDIPFTAEEVAAEKHAKANTPPSIINLFFNFILLAILSVMTLGSFIGIAKEEPDVSIGAFVFGGAFLVYLIKTIAMVRKRKRLLQNDQA